MPDTRTIAAVPTIIKRLQAAHPDARYELDWETPLQLLVATILAAQCTDERVNQVTPGLFKKYPDARAYAEADLPGLEEDLKPTGYFRQKARTVQEVCKALVARFDGQVPRTMEEMVSLPGVARKTANVVLTNAFGLPTGIIVDTHVQRVSRRMGLTDQKKPEKIELDLMKVVPQKDWISFGPAMVLLGRYTCTYHSPACSGCVMNDFCPKRVLEEETEEPAEEHSPDSEEASPTMTAKKTKPTKKTKTTRSTAAKTATAPTAAAAPAGPTLRELLPADWQTVLAAELDKPYFKKLEKFIAEQRAGHTVYPPPEDVFNAFKATPFDKVKVLLLGQDPYHGAGEAHGMCFSVKPGVKVPPSLANIYKELEDDLGCKPPAHGNLQAWAEQGVLLLNAVLTVRSGEPNSHKDQGWETFTDAVIAALNNRAKPVVFLLWGASAQKKEALIGSKHRILKAGHPSPLSSKKFFGTKPFSSANKALQELGQGPISWQLPATATNGVPAAVPAPASVLPAKPAQRPASVKPAVTPAATPAKPATPIPAVVVKEKEVVGLERYLPLDWRAALAEEIRKPYFKALDGFLAAERKDQIVYPAEEDVFAALQYTRLASVRCVILGQEPSCADGVADGLSFSIREGVDLPESLKTIFRELRGDLGCRLPVTGSLAAWAKQGVLLLNQVLTVRAGAPGAHKDKGWETFTDAILKCVNALPSRVVFALWGSAAQKKRALYEGRHSVVTAEHPALSPERFIGSGTFSAINNVLELAGRSAIYWQLQYV